MKPLRMRATDGMVALKACYWAARQQWAHTSLAWWLWAVLTGLTTVTLGGLMAHTTSLQHDIESLEGGLQASLTAPPAAVAPAPMRDFTSELPARVEPLQVLAEFMRSSSSAGVSLPDVAIRTDPVNPDTLGRTEIALQLRGPYPAMRGVIADVMDRYPNVTVRQWRLRNDPSTGVAESSVVLSAWSAARPATPASQGSR
jgi:7-keto-8-aminopelargonate synthetase-like enzyme